MTTLAAIELQDGSILIGSDSFHGSLHELSPDVGQQASISKWARWPGGWAIGAAGHIRVLQEIAEEGEGRDESESFTLREVILGLERLLLAFSEPEREEGFRMYGGGCTFILAAVGHGVLLLDAHLGAQQINAGKFCASGSGREFAYGAFEAIGGNREGMASLEIEQRFTEALEVAIHLDESSGPPVKIEKLELPQRTIKDAWVPAHSKAGAEEIASEVFRESVGARASR